ncbi:MAG: inorganic diphosphatase, partial [Lachnospiraceae bacterium]|nr:inorganic diphosphatase [Lachnospiraceae bacterium]
STSTIVYQMYHEQDLSIDRVTAALLLSAILSDTLMYRSPTCTPLDVRAAEDLARICGVDVEEYAARMFRAGSNLTGKTPEEILGQDFKKFSVEGHDFGVGQVSSMSDEELREIGERLSIAMEEALDKERVDMIFFVLTNILTETSLVMCTGDKAQTLLAEAFPDAGMQKDAAGKETYRVLPGVVSRKKQFLPALVEAIQH